MRRILLALAGALLCAAPASAVTTTYNAGHPVCVQNTVAAGSTGPVGIVDCNKTMPSGDIVGTSDSQTLTNKSISGSTNTITNVGNSSLTNSSMTIGGQSVPLGGSTTNQGNGGKIQLSTGSTTTNNFGSYDANGNIIDSAKAKPSGDVVGTTDTQTLTGKSIDASEINSGALSGARGGFVTLRSLGMLCDGTTDDSTTFTAILAASHLYLDGEDTTCAVSGNFVLPTNIHLRHVAFKQLDSAGSNRRTLTTIGSALTSNIVLDHVKVDRNGLPTEGDVNNYAGIWLANVQHVTLDHVEVTGDGKGNGILLINTGGICDDIRLESPYIHDIRFAQNSDPGSEQAIGLKISTCTNVTDKTPVINTILGNVVVGPYTQLTGYPFTNNVYNIYLPYQTRCQGVNGSTNVETVGGNFSNCGTGADNSGSGTNDRIRYVGMNYSSIGLWAEKWVHCVTNSGSIGSTIYKAGSAGINVTDGQNTDPCGPTHMVFTSPRAIDIAAPYDWGTGSGQLYSGSSFAGFRTQAVGGGLAMSDVKFYGAVAVDDQGSPTMNYGLEQDSTSQDVKWLDPSISGALTSNTHNINANAIFNINGTNTIASAWTFSTGPTFSAAPTFSVAPTFTDQSGTRSALGLGTAATANTSTFGLLSGGNTWSGTQTFSSGLTISNGPLQWNRNALTLVNGLNSNIVPGKVFQRIGGPTGAFSVGGFTTGSDGNVLVLYNSTTQQMTITNEDASSTAANRIKTLTGADVVLRSGTSAATLIYDGSASRWILIASN